MIPPHLASSLRGWRRIAPGPHPWWAATVATVAVGVPLAVTLAAGRPLLAAPATFGALTNLYGRAEPYARRRRTQAWTGLGLTAAVLLGAAGAALPLTGPLDVLVPALLVALVAAVAKFVTDAVRTGPPAGLIPVFAAGTLTAAPVTPADLPLLGAVTLGCAALAVALSGAAGLHRPDGPERNAVARALGSVLAAVEDPRAHPRASADLHAAWEVLAASPLDRAGGHGAWLAHAERVLDAGAPAAALREVLPVLAGGSPLPPPRCPPGPPPSCAGAGRRARGGGRGTPCAPTASSPPPRCGSGPPAPPRSCSPPRRASGTPTGRRSARRPPCSRPRRGSPPSGRCSARPARRSASSSRPSSSPSPPTTCGCGCSRRSARSASSSACPATTPSAPSPSRPCRCC